MLCATNSHIPSNALFDIKGAFGITVDPNMLTVDGRILAAPSILYHGNKTVNARNGKLFGIIDHICADDTGRFLEHGTDEVYHRCQSYLVGMPALHDSW